MEKSIVYNFKKNEEKTIIVKIKKMDFFDSNFSIYNDEFAIF